MRKTLLMLLAVLVCCSSLFVVAGCGPKYVDHPHVGGWVNVNLAELTITI